jgi:hypothetical protein
MFSELSTRPIAETALIVGGLIALVIAIVGKNQKTHVDEVALVIGFFLGAFMIFLAIVLWTNGGWENSTLIVMAVLGIALFFRVIRKVKWAAVVALVVGVAVGYGLYLLSKTTLTGVLTSTVIVIIAVVVMLIVYVTLKFLEDIIGFFGGVLSFRPILFVVGLVGVVEGVLLVTDSSLTQLLG